MSAFDRGRALVIGVGQYSDEEWNVPTAACDASGVYDMLVDPAVGGYPRNWVELLIDDRASFPAVIHGLNRLNEDCTPHHVILISITTRGAMGDDGNYYLATSETSFTLSANRPVVGGTGLSVAKLAQLIGALPAQQVLLIINTCFAVHLKPSPTKTERQPILVESALGTALPDDARDLILATGTGRAIITASKPNRQSYYAHRANYTYFGQALIGALKDIRSAGNSGCLNLFDLHTHIEHQIYSKTNALSLSQEPVLSLGPGSANFPVACAEVNSKYSDPRTTFSDISRQQERLKAYRETLAVYLHQLAIVGIANARPETVHGIHEARLGIAKAKEVLVMLGVTPDSHPDDEES